MSCPGANIDFTLTGSLFANHISCYQPADDGDCCQGSNVQERCCGLVTQHNANMQHCLN